MSTKPKPKRRAKSLKPVSLHPLTLDAAMRRLLKVKIEDVKKLELAEELRY